MHTQSYVERSGNRYWWWRIPGVTHDPLIYLIADNEEKKLLDEWYEDTERENLIGECAPPLASLLIGFLCGNSVDRVVQLGHYSGFSTLHIGLLFRKMKKGKLFSIDVAERVSDYTESWVKKAGLESHVSIVTGDSADPTMPAAAQAYLGGGT